jgi:type VI secretion system Hcp family effector
MPFPAFIKLHLNGSILQGRTIQAWGLEDVREVWEFSHDVGNGHYEDYGYQKQWAYTHSPVTVITEIDDHVPALYRSICADEDLEKVEIFWPQYKTKEHKEDIYFVHKLWPVKLRSVELFFPNVKDRKFEKYGHLAKLVFRYHWIEWAYVQGNLFYKGEWPSFETEGIFDDKQRAEADAILSAPMSDAEKAMADYMDNKTKKPVQQKKQEPAKYDIDKAIAYLKSHYVGTKSKGICATAVREAVLAGGIDISPHPVPAKDYGPFLKNYGFNSVSDDGWDSSEDPVKGDIAVLQGYNEKTKKNGHITMFDGIMWRSDFVQNDMWSGPGYRENTPDFTVYRWQGETK